MSAAYLWSQAAEDHLPSDDDVSREEVDRIRNKQRELENRVRIVEIQLRAMDPDWRPPDAA